MSSWKGKSRGGIAGYKIFVALLKYPGISFAYFLLRFVAFYYFLFSGRSFVHIYSFYRHRLGFGFFKSVADVYRNYYRFGQVLLDRTAQLAGLKTNFTFDFEGEQHLRSMVENRTGGLLISAHIGNFEMAGQLLERLGTHVNIIMYDAEHERIRKYLSGISQRTFQVILVKEDGSHIYEIRNALENKEIVCLHGDRFVQGGRSHSGIFLDREAAFPAGPFYLAMTYQVPVSFVFAMKENRKHYHFYASKPERYHTMVSGKNKQDVLGKVIGDFAGQMESMVRRYPLQWFNYYDFWK